MKQIPLTQGKFALVDDEDFEYLSQFKWTLVSSKGKEYAYRGKTSDGIRTTYKMHRVILGITDPKKSVDHKDGNGLNNQRKNLRSADQKQNCQNRNPRKNKSSKFKGVSIENRLNRKPYWASTICIDGRQKTLKRYPHTPCGEILAAVHYDTMAEKHFGEFANLNFK